MHGKEADMRTSSLLNTLLCLAACFCIATAPAIAADDDNDRLDDAWEDALGDNEPILTDKQFALLNNLAFQAAAAEICDGFKLDGDKFSTAIAEATSPPPPDMTEEDAKHWQTAVLIRFGTSYGLLLAEGNDEDDEFCKSAKELKADSEVPNVWQ
jgi:hypothetical protein